MAGTDSPQPDFEPGQRFLTRGHPWTLLDLERGAGCAALRLACEDDDRTQILLSPYDRFERVPVHDRVSVVPARRWLRQARLIAGLARPAGGLQGAAAARIRLLAYQLEPALASLRHGATRLLIADAVGLGKTIQAGLLIAELARQQSTMRALILVPAGLRDQWAQELRRLFALTVVTADAAWLRRVARERPPDVNPWCLPGLYLASQDLVKRPEVLRPLEDATWDLVVVDEAHALSAGSDRRAAAHAVAQRASRVVLLTATPRLDDPTEFDALCGIGRIDRNEPPVIFFRRSREEAGGAMGRRATLLAVRPTSAELRMHELLDRYTSAVWKEAETRGDDRARLVAITLRKRALSGAASLAASVRRRMDLLMPCSAPASEQLRLPLPEDEDPLEDLEPASVLAAPGLTNAPRERRWLAAVAEAAQHASRAESKSRFLGRLLRRVREPALVFTEYRDTLQRLRAALESDGLAPLLLHGGMGPADRCHVQRTFNGQDAVLLATDAASEGLNLHARCRFVVHYELPWSTTRLEQRAGRVDRLGQQRRVHEVALVASSTAESLVLGPLLRRCGRARSAGAASSLAGALTESRVADAIIGGRPTPASQAAPPRLEQIGSLSLRDEAEAEVRRLMALRACRALEEAADGRPRAPRVIASSIRSTRSTLDAGLILVYLISLTSPAGRPVHVDAVVVSLSMTPAASRSVSPRSLRALVQPYSNPRHPAVGPLLDAAVDRALNMAAPVHARVQTALLNRHEHVGTLRATAARQLVQAGLFDRSARNPLERDRERWHAPTPAIVPVRNSILSVDVALAAALAVVHR
jgi:superfamily II DNA or RNA helicase